MSGSTTLKIYDWHNGPYPARVRIALAEKGLQSQTHFISVDLRKGEHKTEEFRAKNYSGTLPVLELGDGTLIAECTAITEYLDALDGTPMLTGRTPRDCGAWISGSDGRCPSRSRFHAVRTYSGRPRSSMRFSTPTAMATSVARRRSVRERSASPITRLNRLTSASTRARQL